MIGFHNEPEPEIANEDVKVDERDVSDILTDLAEALHDVASQSNEAGIVRMAVNALIRHDIGIKMEFGE